MSRTAEVEEAIKGGKTAEYFTQLSEQLLDLVRLVRGDITKLQRMSIGALVVIDVHAKDTVEKLAKEKIDDCMSFEWISQLRYYWEMDDRNSENMWVRMVQTPFPYGYEYLGNSFRLVITPLTDMCYMTLMGAQSLNLGGAPAGPAGTGKTETTKDLAKALAKQCVVFNCSPEMDYLMVGKFFKGLASSGAWCCFDEFNRIYIEVLSVIAQQLLQLFSAKRELTSYNDSVELEFDSTLIMMRPTFNVFITMNPGYAGRSELPDNLAALFRPMAMMVPDYAMIGEISFYAFGFEKGRHLAKKMVTTFQLCSEQLSAQSHYDYGMRAVKTVIEAAGLNKRKYPDQSEGQILLRALQDVNVPKFLKDDLPLFYNIISDLFPGVEKPAIDYGKLDEMAKEKSKDTNLQPTEYFIKKQFELFDMIQVRHGMMLVGPTGGGKTCCYRTLQAACTALVDPKDGESPFQKTHVHVLNPKAITQNQLYGAFDEVTREWSDGVAAELIRNATRDNHNPDHHWVMFDGPVDALWIESMNTVLDDNKKLCLVSGEIIALTAKMRMQFEVEDLEVASPATVSRCGMIYMEPESLGFQPFFDSWLEALPETFSFKPILAQTLRRLLEEVVPPCIAYVNKKTVRCAPGSRTYKPMFSQFSLPEHMASQAGFGKALFKLMDCYFVNYQPTELKPAACRGLSPKTRRAEGCRQMAVSNLVPLFFFCLIWSVGATCDAKSRKGFNDLVWATVNEDLRPSIVEELEKAFLTAPPVQPDVELPGLEPGEMLYDYFYDQEKKQFVPWMTTIPKFEVPRGAKYEEIVVRLVYIFQLLVLNDKHVLCPGPTGTGKSVNISLWLQKQAPENYQGVFINFSAQTHVNQLQDLIDSKLEKRRRGVYGPPAGKKMLAAAQDLNMPLKEYYGAQPPIELIRQWHDHGGWYNRKELVKQGPQLRSGIHRFNIIDVVMVSAMGPPGGGRTFITERSLDASLAVIVRIGERSSDLLRTAYSDLSDVLPPLLSSTGAVLRCSASTWQVSIKHIFDVISKYFFAVGHRHEPMASGALSLDDYKQLVREAMRRDGVHSKFLEVPFKESMPETFSGHNLPLGLSETVEPCEFFNGTSSQKDTYLEELLRKSGPEVNLLCMDWGVQPLYHSDPTRFALDPKQLLPLTLKGLAPSQKEERGLELKKMYNPDLDGKGTGQLTVNEKAIVGAEHRLFRVVWFVALLKPDIICLQELDNFTFLSKELQKLGYACSSPDAEAYVPLKDRTGSTYSEKLASSSWAFAPKTGFKKGKSTARHFLEKRVADGRFHGQDAWPVDDDGQAIFWRADRFQMVGKPEFQTLPGDPDIDAFVEGTSEVPGPAERTVKSGEFSSCILSALVGIFIKAAPLGPMLGSQRSAGDLATYRSMDANTELDFDDADSWHSRASLLQRTKNHAQDLRSIWEEFYSSTRDMWNPPVSVWKMRGSASAQPKKVGEDMYQLIDHIFYDGRHLFQLGEQALRLREKCLGHCMVKDHADRDWLALMPNELLPSDHLPIVPWDFQLQIKSPRIESTVLLSTAEQLFNQLMRPWLKPDDETLVEIEALFKPLYFAGALTAKTELGQLPDAAIDIFHALKTLSRKYVGPWFCGKIADEAKVVLSYELVYGTSRLEDFRERIIAATGRHQSKATYEAGGKKECCLVEALLFSAAAVVAAGQWVDHARKQTSCMDNSKLRFVNVGTQLLGDVRNLITLAAMRCIMRTFTAVPKADEQCVEIMSKGQLWALLAQLTSTIAPSCHHMVVALDNDGLVDPKDMNGLLGEIGEQLASRQCATGSHVAAAVKMLFQAIESGKIPFLEQHMNNVPEEPPAGSASDAIKLLRTGSNSPKPSLLKNTPLVFRCETERVIQEFLHKQTFDQSAAIAALSALAMSGNLDSGGGLALMLESLQRQIALVQGSQVPERQARALRRPPPWVVASFVRRAVVTACESLEPIVSVQKLHVHEQAKKRAKVNPVEELIQALIELPQDGIQSQAHTFGREAVPALWARCVVVPHGGKAQSFAPSAWHDAREARSGSDRIRDVLRCLESRLNSACAGLFCRGSHVPVAISEALLPADDLQRWKTHLNRAICSSAALPERGSLALRSRAVVEEPEGGSVQVRVVVESSPGREPEEEERSVESILTEAARKTHSKRSWDAIAPWLAAVQGPTGARISMPVGLSSACAKRDRAAVPWDREAEKELWHPAEREIRSQKSFDLSKILDEIDKFEFVKTLHRAQSRKRSVDTHGDTCQPAIVNLSTDGRQALNDLLPTPAKSHYLFNLRDIWKVFLGLCSLSSKKSNNPLTVTRCWAHEIQRVFGDRLTDSQDLQWMKTQVEGAVSQDLEQKLEVIFNKERLIFASFLTQEVENRTYDEITDMQAMKQAIEEYLEDYNQVFSITMPLVMFLDACEHCARICRVLSQPNGNVLLLGVGGSGRQSLTRLSAYMNEADCFQIEVAKGYGMTEFKDDVKKCLMKCGVEDKVQIFLFCDTQIVKEDFVEAINNVLNSGDVPNLYANEDFEAISSSCRQLCQSMGMQPTKANLFSAYLSRVKKNVHVTLAFSPVGDSFRNRLRSFPSLVNCCTIDWFHEWPAEALYSVAKQQITGQSVELPNLEGSLKMFQTIHQSVETSSRSFLKATNRHVYVTPTSFLELLNSFVGILADKRKQVGMLQHRYSVGLGKIGDAEEQVAGLQQMLVDKKPMLEKTQKEVGEMMVVITKDKGEAEEVSKAVAAEEAAASVKAEETQAIKDDAQRDLDEALPALDQAVECLRKLKKEHIQEVKALANPPAGVRLACEGVCIMFQLKPVKKPDPSNPSKKIEDYWETSQKQVLVDAKKLLEDLMDFDKDNIPDKVIQTIGPYIDREDFDPAAIKKASIACEALCLWVRAMYKYHFVAKAVEPKRKLLKQAEAELAECQEKLDAAQSQLRQVQNKIAALEADFNGAVEKQKELQDDMNLCEVKLQRAHKLIGGLGGEKARWGQNVQDLNAQLGLLPGDCIVAAGMVSYAGPFTSQVRSDCEELWRKELTELEMAHTKGCSMSTVLGDPVKIQQWVVCSLPNDQLSIENGIIIDRARRWPLMIDPQRQANKYIKNMGKDTETGIDVCKLSEKNFLRTLELGIQFGKWILLENIGINLDPALEPVLGQQKVKDGSGYVIKLGDKSVTYTETFKFFMTTTLPNPHYSPETSVKVTLLNFAITPSGLEDQMLGIVVAKERPDLEEEKNNLVVQNAKNNKILKDIEDDILRLLATSEGDVLEDDTLVDKVTDSKAVSDDINEKKKVAEVTEKNIDAARESYRPVAFRTAVLFFCIVELTNIDPMYQYSLQWFQKLFTIAIDTSPKSEDFEERLGILKSFFTEALYQSICRGLFEKDKTLFSFALCTSILRGDKLLDDGELRFLLVGPTADLVEKGPPIPEEWVGKPRWNEILTLSTLPAFAGFSDYFASHVSDFKKLYDSVEADKEPVPGEWEAKLTPMQKMCFIRAMRIDCLKSSVITFISHQIGQAFVEPPTFDISKSFADSVNTTPLIFILSPGTDPVSDVIAFADKLGMLKRFESISLGQGQGPKAMKLIENAQGSGGWVLLSNCHLMESWMPTLEAVVEQFNPDNMQTSFRLWLTSMPAKSFPVQVLQNGVKMTNEPPSGLRANLLRSYSALSDELFKESNKPEIFKTLLFGFCFFHAVVQDRRKFGPIGWNIAYGFTPEDLQVCRQQLMLFVNQYEQVPYKVLNFLGAKINYGGRVTDDKDKLLISTILQTFICPESVEQKDGYKYSTSGLYYAPAAETMEEFITYIKGLPLYPMPEAFGLHENCNITCAQDEALKLLTGMQSMVSLSSGGGEGGSADSVMDDTAASIQDRLPKPFPLDVCETKFPTLYEESMNTVVKQECLRYNKLIWSMTSSLKDFRKAIKGLIVMTAELEAAGKSLFVNEVPEMWSKKGPLSLKPLSSWYLDILARVGFFQMWFDLGHAPPVFWISGIFFPQAFFTGAMQNFARKYGEEIDLLSFSQHTMDHISDAKAQLTTPPDDGVYVYGIFLEGARFDNTTHQLEESRPKELFTDLPPLQFLPVKNRVPNAADYRCPCYKVVSRKGTLLTTGHSTNFVLYIEVKTDQVVDKWIKAGVAAFLALKY
ncbi:Dnah1 [Symbiodinium sp. CCMP2456]|nr:Dnah1 [Symbiodinium sp. CCMP2456]